MFQLYNSYSQKIEPFKTLEPHKVRMYVCGITPYDTTHMGHAFTYVQFDTLVRFLKYSGYSVDYTQNVTDIDDDILKRAVEEGRDWRELGDFWTKRYLDDMKSLNVKTPTHFVKATDSIATIIRIIRVLIEKGHGYEKKGMVYFDVSTFKTYGELSHFSEPQMLFLSRERGANPDDKNKKNPLDFVLWQSAREGEPSWDSPFGKGRPGWHIECSAMINDTLGTQIDPFDKLRVNGEHSRTIDIHGGGKDLIFPHHESERAQSESYSGKSPFVSSWMHLSMVEYQGEKMSKSLGNMIMIKDLLKKYSPQGVRLYLLSNHYRKPWEYDENELSRYEQMAKKILAICSKNEKVNNDVSLEFMSSLENDFDTPKALQILENSLSKSPSSVESMTALLGLI